MSDGPFADRIRRDFRGKHGQRQRCEVRGAKLARIVAAMKRLPGDEVFEFVDARAGVRDPRGEHLNDYIQRVMGRHFSAHVFRTWGATLLCAAALSRAAQRELSSAGARRAAMASAVRATAAHLGGAHSSRLQGPARTVVPLCRTSKGRRGAPVAAAAAGSRTS